MCNTRRKSNALPPELIIRKRTTQSFRRRFISMEPARHRAELNTMYPAPPQIPVRRCLRAESSLSSKVRIGRSNVEKIDHTNIDEQQETDHILQQFQLRTAKIKGEIIAMPTDADFDEIVENVFNRMGEFENYLSKRGKERKVSAAQGKKQLYEKFKAAHPEEKKRCKKEIEDLLKKSLDSHILIGGKNRIELRTRNSKKSLFLNKNQESEIKNLKLENFHEEIEENNIRDVSGLHLEARRELRVKSQSCCNCVGGKCDKNCECGRINNALKNDTIYDPEHNRSYSCSIHCACKGKCGKTFPEPPENSTEAVLHNFPQKGFVSRALQYFGQGETVATMTGSYCRVKSLQDDDNYALDIYNKDQDKECILELFNQNKKLAESKKLKMLSEDVKDTLTGTLGTTISLDPRFEGNHGRFLSSSCLGNVKTNFVYQGGLAPTNIRVMMTSKMPIFPNQELSFFYGFPYVTTQLKNICLCGELCCITNRHLFPFIKRNHIIRFYKRLYGVVYGNFKAITRKSPRKRNRKN